MIVSLSKLLVVLSLGAASLAQAAPPRFDNWGAWNRDTETVSPGQTPATNVAAAAPGAGDSPAAASAAPVENVEADLIPPALLAPQADSPSSANDRRRGDNAASTPDSERRSFWSMFKKRQPIIPKERTQKTPAALISTYERHKDTVDLLGIGDTRYFGPKIYEARWQVSGDRMQCTLRQELPLYGYVAFRQGSRQGLRFELHVKRAPAGLTQAHVQSLPPPWKPYAQEKDLGVIALTTDERALEAEVTWARYLMNELAEGMQPTLRYWNATDAAGDVEVQISPMHFRQGLKAFQDCLTQLVRIDFSAMDNTVVYFGFDSAELKDEAREKLDKLALVLNSDARVSRVVIEGHTDSRGFRRYNEELATRRARRVRQYLLDQGVAEEKLQIKLRAFGETKPGSSNRTAAGRAENRRVEISVHRASDQA